MVKVHLNSEIYVLISATDIAFYHTEGDGLILIFTRHELKRLEALQSALIGNGTNE